ncbi:MULTISPECIES: hypothetical protein [Kitasatospora]|uniref:Uncharacterized protein n=1 Tax=Kitasatospora cystarginea TaxID=58350 RepID=A0ABN3EJF6_9ACTN
MLALLAVADPATLDHSALAEAALRSAETEADVQGACEALQALDTAALTGSQHRRLTALAERDRRIVSEGSESEIIRSDELLRRQLRATLAAATTTPSD